ncbi:CDP-diacylglycerol--glycerol-3-phosphate 3-phosphatidyltransferase [Enterococcus hirae]|nr:CDP-diacylglycerol--glycerol-3-phosphate 3-phosphatidyltransferase [Enterococcus hirae]
MNLPNKLTVLRICLIPVFILLMAVDWQWGMFSIQAFGLPLNQLLAAIVFAFASFTDWLDGHIARAHHLVTNFGKFADPLADKMLVMTAFIMLVAIGKVPGWVAAIIICRELAVTGLRLLLVEESGEVLAAAWPGKVKTATQMFAIIFLLLNNFPFALIGLPFDQLLLYLCLIFTIYSGIDYFAKNREVFKGSM